MPRLQIVLQIQVVAFSLKTLNESCLETFNTVQSRLSQYSITNTNLKYEV